MSADVQGVPGERARIALVLVSHSQRLAEGAVELAAQMAPGVVLLGAGGSDDGGIGTSYDRVSGALTEALTTADGVVVLADLGSAVMTVESVLELDDDLAQSVRLADAPFVEGAVAAAVTAHGGGALADVLSSAEAAGGTFAAGAAAPATSTAADGEATEGLDGLTKRVALRNPLGLHARPAAVLARMIAGYDAKVTINGVNGASVLELMKLGAAGGQELVVAAEGPQGAEVLAAVVTAIEEGFGEV